MVWFCSVLQSWGGLPPEKEECQAPPPRPPPVRCTRGNVHERVCARDGVCFHDGVCTQECMCM